VIGVADTSLDLCSGKRVLAIRLSGFLFLLCAIASISEKSFSSFIGVNELLQYWLTNSSASGLIGGLFF
tara:strand:+ start:6394 stop:6600 length:207 start_codon:yes stop_codon:yes gene_type:complete